MRSGASSVIVEFEFLPVRRYSGHDTFGIFFATLKRQVATPRQN